MLNLVRQNRRFNIPLLPNDIAKVSEVGSHTRGKGWAGDDISGVTKV